MNYTNIAHLYCKMFDLEKQLCTVDGDKAAKIEAKIEKVAVKLDIAEADILSARARLRAQVA